MTPRLRNPETSELRRRSSDAGTAAHRIGLDIDGTITADFYFFADVARKWLQAGREVHIVSARSPEARVETLVELKRLGVEFSALYLLPHYGVAWTLCPHAELDWYHRHLWLKVNYALTHGVTHFVDDDPMVLGLFARFAPEVTALSFDNRHQLASPSRGSTFQSRRERGDSENER